MKNMAGIVLSEVNGNNTLNRHVLDPVDQGQQQLNQTKKKGGGGVESGDLQVTWGPPIESPISRQFLADT